MIAAMTILPEYSCIIKNWLSARVAICSARESGWLALSSPTKPSISLIAWSRN